MFALTPFSRNVPRSRTQDITGFYNMIDDFFSDNWSPARSLKNDTFKIDVRDSEKEYLIDAELPGVKKEEITLSLEDGRLLIGVNHEEKVDEEKENYIHRERRTSSMQRGVYLGDVKNDGVVAKFENGILCITVPKAEPETRKSTIQIQ